MAPGTLAAVGVVNAVAALSFLAVGVRLARREVPRGDRLALQAIAGWWLAMGVLLAIQAAETLAAFAGHIDVGVSNILRYGNGVLLAIGGWGLCFHVLYLRTGRMAWAARLVPYFLVVAAMFAASVATHPLVALEPTGHDLVTRHDPPLEGSLLWNVVVILSGIPLIAASILYLRLSRRLALRDQKRRAILASTGILSWVGAGLVAQIVAGDLGDFLTLTVMGLVAAILVFLAYFPPAWLRKGDAPGPYLEVVAPRLPQDELLYGR